MLAVQVLPDVVQERQRDHGILRTQRAHTAAGSHLSGQLVQIRKQIAEHFLFTGPEPVGRHLNITQHIRPAIREVQIVLQDMPEDILLRQSSQRQQPVPGEHRPELIGRCQHPGNLCALRQSRRGQP